MDIEVARGQEAACAVNGHRSGWTEVRSGVLLGSVLRPPLFTIFIDDINEEVLCEFSKFTNVTKIPSRVNNFDDIILMQMTLDKLVDWANRWGIDLIVNECGVMHIGKRNLKFLYQMNDGWIKSVKWT